MHQSFCTSARRFGRPLHGGAALGATLFALVCAATSQADSATDFRPKLEKWVEARTLLSKERSDWIVEKQFLEASRDMLRNERDALREEVKELEAKHSGADRERGDLVAQRAEFQQAAGTLEAKVRALEERVLGFVPRLPEPLQDRLEVLLVQIPEDPENARAPLGQRLMNVLGVLAQCEKWNSTAHFVGETRAIGDSESADKVLVRTLYWGLAQAIYVDAQGRTAGVGHPGENGWVFEDVRGLNADAKKLLDIYEGNVDTIAFVPMPVEVR